MVIYIPSQDRKDTKQLSKSMGSAFKGFLNSQLFMKSRSPSLAITTSSAQFDKRAKNQNCYVFSPLFFLGGMSGFPLFFFYSVDYSKIEK